MTRRWTVLTLLVGVGIVAVAGYAIGAGKSSKDLVLCATKKSGDLSLASAKGKCAKGEKKLTVAKEGPVGPMGAPGPAGPAASAALEPITFVKPAVSPCAASPGAFCLTNPAAGHLWENLSAGGAEAPLLTGYYKDLGGVVHLVGSARFNIGGGGAGENAPAVMFYLPPGFRPAQGVPSFSQPCGGKDQTVLVYGDGKVEIDETKNWCASFEGLSFHP